MAAGQYAALIKHAPSDSKEFTDVNSYSAMAATASRVLADHAERLPEVAGVGIRSTTQGTHPARFRRVISLQMFSSVGEEVAGVARWADAFDAPVRLLCRDGYVEVSTQTVVTGHPVLVWDHIALEEADRFVAALGERLEAVLDIEPARLTAIHAAVSGRGTEGDLG